MITSRRSLAALPAVLALAAALALAPRAVTQDGPDRPVESAQSQVAAVLREATAYDTVPGAVAAWVDGRGETGVVCVGHVAGDPDRPVREADRLLSGSIGKTYVAAIALQEFGAGRLDDEQKAEELLGDQEWFARLPNAGDLTLRHLLRHTSGIPEHVRMPAFAAALRADPDRVWERVELLEFILDAEPLFPAGAGWSYADTNYVVLGLVLEAHTGRSIEELIRERLLEPLNLADTVFSNRRQVPGLVAGHRSGLILGGEPGPAVTEGRYFVNPQFEWCGGGMASTTLDLARWGHAWATGKAFPADLLADIQDGVPARTGPGDRYGYGSQILKSPLGTNFGHSGFMPGYLSIVQHYPEQGVTVAVQLLSDDLRALRRSPRYFAERIAPLIPARPAPDDTPLRSPDDRLEFQLDVDEDGLRYRVTRDDQELIGQSSIEPRIADHTDAWRGATVTGVTQHDADRSWTPPYGTRARIVDRHRERSIALRGATGLRMDLRLRLFDGGVAWRYEIPEQLALDEITVQAEATTLRFPRDGKAWFTNRAQGVYRQVPLSAMPADAERPLVIELADGPVVALTEAGLVDSARTKFNPLGDGAPGVVTRMDGPATFALPWRSPWRVVLVEDSAAQLLERGYDSLLTLNDAAAMQDTTWIRPGKVMREVTLTDAGGRAVVDFCARHGIRYCHIDAGWYGNEYDDASDATTCTVDPKRSPGPLDVPALVEYAAARDIGIILYVNRRALERQLDEILPLYQSWGVAGVKYGFVRVGSQDATRFLHEAIAKAAAHGLVVNVHDEYRPTGVERTWPNLLTAEGVRGDEESPPMHQTLAHAFCRGLAGPTDNTYCYFDPRVGGAMGNHAAQLAKSVVFYSPLQYVYWYDRPAGSPGAGDIATATADRVIDESLPELAFWDRLPTTWDDTRVVAAEIGAHLTIARRSGEDWHVGMLNADEPRRLQLRFDFLEAGRTYRATVHQHDEKHPSRTQVRIEQRDVQAGTTWSLELAANDGVAIRIVPRRD